MVSIVQVKRLPYDLCAKIPSPFPPDVVMNLHVIYQWYWMLHLYRSQISVFYSGLVLQTHQRKNMPRRKCPPAPSVGEKQHGHSLEQNGATK